MERFRLAAYVRKTGEPKAQLEPLQEVFAKQKMEENSFKWNKQDTWLQEYGERPVEFELKMNTNSEAAGNLIYGLVEQIQEEISGYLRSGVYVDEEATYGKTLPHMIADLFPQEAAIFQLGEPTKELFYLHVSLEKIQQVIQAVKEKKVDITPFIQR